MQTLLNRIATQAQEAIAAGRAQAAAAREWLEEQRGLAGLAEVAAWQGPPEEERDLLAALHCLLLGMVPPPYDAEQAGWGEAIESRCGCAGASVLGLLRARGGVCVRLHAAFTCQSTVVI